MAQDAAKREEGARELADTIFVQTGVTGHSNHVDLTAAIGAIDDVMDELPAALNPVRTMKQNILDSLPEPFASNSTNLEKAHALIHWALNEIS